MSSKEQVLASVRDSTCAVMRIVRQGTTDAGKKPPQVQFQLAFTGTATCFVQNKYLLTAYHILNDGKPRDPAHKFFAFIVPGNGPIAYHFPIVGFPFEDQAVDMAVLELGPPVNHKHQLTPVPMSFNRPRDGASVLTYGFPAPTIAGGNVDSDGNFLGGGNFFLKGRANEGIVSAQYDINGNWFYEFSVAWHHGESGGPVCGLDPVAGFAMMQQYRNIQTPHGIIPGPHGGRSLQCIQDTLSSLGATIV